MKILLLGSGYVGGALLSFFKEKGFTVYVSTCTLEKVPFLEKKADRVILLKEADLEKEAFKTLLEEIDFLCITVAPKEKASYEETYLKTALSLKKILEKRERPLKLLYTSSTSVYQGVLKEWVTEEEVLFPLTEEAKILLETERTYLGIENPFIKKIIFRLGGITGPERTLEERKKRVEGKILEGSGFEYTNHSFLEKIVEAIYFAFKNPLEGIYNVVSDWHPLRKELYKALWKEPFNEKKRGYKVSSDKITKEGFVI